ncbi:MAG: Uma2 family endonuclease [Elainellaceae cyanobacterium]
MTPAFVTQKWTVDDYHRMIVAGILSDRSVELLNGEIVETAPEGESHAHLSSVAADYLREVLRGRAKIREGKPITLPNASEPEPDIAVVEDLGDVYFEHHPYPENVLLAVEYSDTSLIKDLEVKRRTYAEAGIAEYWVINLRRMELVAFREPSDGDYREKRTLVAGVTNLAAIADVAIAVERFLRR